MQRILGAIAIFAGWLSIPIGAMAGMFYSQFFGLGHVEGPVPPSSVYGISGAVVLWIFVAAALVLAVPLASAMVATDPRRTLRVLAAVMAVTCVALFPDELGRVFGLPLLIGALCLWFGSDAIHHDSLGSPTPASVRPETWLSTATTDLDGSPDLPAVAGRDGSAPFDTTATPDLRQMGSAIAPNSPASPVEAAQPLDQPQALDSTTTGHAGSGRVCPWCSTEVPQDAESCPNCRASLDATADSAMAIPGVTEVSPDLRRYAEEVSRRQARPSLLKMIFSDSAIPTPDDAPPPSDAAALRPPSDELKAEIARLDADIAAGALSTGWEEPGNLAGAGRAGGTTAAESAGGGASAAEAGGANTPAGEPESRPARRTRRVRGSGPRT